MKERLTRVFFHAFLLPHGELTEADTPASDDSREVFALLSTLRGLPSNPDKDIYGLDTRLAFTHDMQWDNGGDESVGSVEAENKDDFKRVVDSLLAAGETKGEAGKPPVRAA